MAGIDANPDYIAEHVPPETGFTWEQELWIEANLDVIKRILQAGVSGTFTTADAKTVTVTRGIITNIT